ncbi:hypothetical protein EV644_104148 [Kribbella orskensis]|jgi:hypothetical protein|uniref:Killing trait domain-containing protein n=1 Tax=Kribbella orskensis TaxID=2512216 RepID=A0ABY2BMK2_9ACTN|nr:MULTISPECIES: hypothetical protein [Kribbella]TCN41766.1 hypothetical protein EV642_103148 [Kribbella sp. VKM Ac-2500]TCO25644.1 hypothetical protein EV644_104148 [Kribbella orskensis]
MTNLGRISRTEVANQSVDLLPAREALALVNITNITAINLAIAVNAATIGSTASAVALQHVAAFQR